MRQALLVFNGFALATLLAFAPPARAQTSTDYAWRVVAEQGGVRLDYLHYPSGIADSARADAVVLKLHNTNAHAIAYRFTVVFRSADGARVEELAVGEIEARGGRTGTLGGLHFTPFPAGVAVAEIGLRGLRVERAGEGRAIGERDTGP